MTAWSGQCICFGHGSALWAQRNASRLAHEVANASQRRMRHGDGWRVAPPRVWVPPPGCGARTPGRSDCGIRALSILKPNVLGTDHTDNLDTQTTIKASSKLMMMAQLALLTRATSAQEAVLHAHARTEHAGVLNVRVLFASYYRDRSALKRSQHDRGKCWGEAVS